MASSSFVASDPLVHVAFNVDATHLVVATSSGIRALSCSPLELEHVFSRGGFAGEVNTADLLLAQESSSSSEPLPLVAVVLGDDTIRYCSQPPHGQMMDAGNGGGGVVRAIRHVGDHVAVARDYRVTLYQISSRHEAAAKLIMEVDTGPNQVGACALALVDGGQGGFVLACPTPTVGEVQIWHKGRAAAVRVHAHDLSVACVELSGDGQLLATADSMGSYAFISSTTDGLVRQELRVCCTRAVVSSMAFSCDSEWLAVSSDRAAVHLFNAPVDLTPFTPPPEPSDDEPDANSSYWSSHDRALSMAHFTIKDPVQSFRLDEGIRYRVAFGQEPNTILVIGMDGNFYRCQYDPVIGRVKQIAHRNVMDTM